MASRRSCYGVGPTNRPTHSTAPSRARTCSRSTPHRRRHRGRCTSVMCFPTRIPTRSRVISGCAARPSSTRSGGMTTACPPNAGCKTSTASGVTPRCPMTPTSPRRRSPGSRKSRSRAVTSSTCATSARSSTRSRSRSFSAPSECRLTGTTSTARSTKTRARRRRRHFCAM